MPVTVALIYVLLVITFRTQAASLLVLLSVPFAFVGGALALNVRHMNFKSKKKRDGQESIPGLVRLRLLKHDFSRLRRIDALRRVSRAVGSVVC